jgi:hypothetical protein
MKDERRKVKDEGFVAGGGRTAIKEGRFRNRPFKTSAVCKPPLLGANPWCHCQEITSPEPV